MSNPLINGLGTIYVCINRIPIVIHRFPSRIKVIAECISNHPSSTFDLLIFIINIFPILGK